MGRRLCDLTGQKFGKWEVVKRVDNRGSHAYWLCRCCDCGDEKEICGGRLREKGEVCCKNCKRIAKQNIKQKEVMIKLHGGLEVSIGQRFGRLIAIKYIGNRKWLCKCDCGNEKECYGNNLKSGRTTSCGCFRKEINSDKAEDLTGQKFGRLEVVKRAENRGGQVYWLCKCDCGDEIEVRGVSLKNGDTTSCGCIRRRNWIGERFGRLVVVEKKGIHETSRCWRLLCKCDCGNEVISYSNALSSGQTTSCGCFFREVLKETHSGENNYNWKGGITPIREHLRSLQIVKDWNTKARVNAHNRCELSGQKASGEYGQVHHIKPFCELVIEAHILNNIKIKPNVADYNKEELKLLENYITEWHKDTSNAILLHIDVHNYFHNEFMKGRGRESSVEDVEEFKQRYLNGEFGGIVGSN